MYTYFLYMNVHPHSYGRWKYTLKARQHTFPVPSVTQPFLVLHLCQSCLHIHCTFFKARSGTCATLALLNELRFWESKSPLLWFGHDFYRFKKTTFLVHYCKIHFFSDLFFGSQLITLKNSEKKIGKSYDLPVHHIKKFGFRKSSACPSH